MVRSAHPTLQIMARFVKWGGGRPPRKRGLKSGGREARPTMAGTSAGRTQGSPLHHLAPKSRAKCFSIYGAAGGRPPGIPGSPHDLN
jgi:hypothetical protein